MGIPMHGTPSERPNSGLTWIKSSLSFSNGNCVEVASLADGGVGIRNSRDAEGAVLDGALVLDVADAQGAQISTRRPVKRPVHHGRVQPVGPTNKGAYKFIPENIARELPTYPANLLGLVYEDPEWIGANQAKIEERWAQWIAGV